MEAFVMKILPLLLIAGPIESNVVDRSPLDMKNITGANGRPVVRNNAKKKEVDNHFTRFRRSLHDPYEACFRSFFVDGQPPIGLRKNLHNIRYICQQVPRSREVFYGTMFDEDIGLAVYSAYTLTQQTVNFGQVQGVRGWRQEPGIERQGSDVVYQNQPYQRGHLVPARTFSSNEERYVSTYKHTNAVPQRAPFNRGQWSQFERRIRRYAQNTCTQAALNGVLFLITGTAFVHIQNNPLQVNPVPINVLPAAQNNPGIAIPNSMWTAGCCVLPNGNAQSFAVMGNNVLNVNQMLTQQITLVQLQNFLTADVTNQNIGGPNVNLFPGNGNCALAPNNLAQLPPAGVGR